jgi:hypothetical protein
MARYYMLAMEHADARQVMTTITNMAREASDRNLLDYIDAAEDRVENTPIDAFSSDSEKNALQNWKTTFRILIAEHNKRKWTHPK